MPKKVFIVNRSTHDFSAAGKFGELIFMSEGNIPRLAASKMCRLFKPFIEESSQTDYILLTSMTIMCTLACGMFAAKHGRLNLLIYIPESNVSGHYVSRVTVFKEVNNNA